MYVSNEEENYENLGALLLTVATPTVQDIFRKRNSALPPESRWSRVPGTASNFFKVLCISKEGSTMYNKVMTMDQKNKLKDEDVSGWDLTLLHILLTNIDFSSGSEEITAEHAEENGCVRALKDTRNKFAHFSESKIPQKKFDKLWQNSEKALLSLSVPPETMKALKESGIVRSFQIFAPPSVNLVKRPQVLQDLHSQLSACSTKDSLEERIVVLCGYDGIGKTEKARMYVHTYRNDPIIQQNVAWINAEDLHNLEASFLTIASVLHLSTERKSLVEIAQNVFKHFSEYITAGIFIFDNLLRKSDQSFELSDYLPKPSQDLLGLDLLYRFPLFLITTRNCDKLNGNYKIIQITTFLEPELRRFVSQKFNIDMDKDVTEDGRVNHKKLAIEKLIKELHGVSPELIVPAFELGLQRLNRFMEQNVNNALNNVMGHIFKLSFKK